MLIKFISILALILIEILFVRAIFARLSYARLVKNKRIRIFKNIELGMIPLKIPDTVHIPMVLIKENAVIDNDIKAFQRKLFKCYIIGTHHYFVLNRMTGKMNIFNDYHSLSKRNKKIFNKLSNLKPKG